MAPVSSTRRIRGRPARQPAVGCANPHGPACCSCPTFVPDSLVSSRTTRPPHTGTSLGGYVDITITSHHHHHHHYHYHYHHHHTQPSSPVTSTRSFTYNRYANHFCPLRFDFCRPTKLLLERLKICTRAMTLKVCRTGDPCGVGCWTGGFD